VVWLLFSQFIKERPRSNSFARPKAAVAPKVKLVVSLVLTSILATRLALWLALFKRVGVRSNASGVKKSALYNAPLISPDELTFWRSGSAKIWARALSVMRYTPPNVGRVSFW